VLRSVLLIRLESFCDTKTDLLQKDKRKVRDQVETFSPMERVFSIRLLIAVASHYNLNLHHMEFKRAFLNPEFKEALLIDVSEGFTRKGPSDEARPITRFVFKFQKGPISWLCNKQQTVTVSSAESECLALSFASKKLFGWKD